MRNNKELLSKFKKDTNVYIANDIESLYINDDNLKPKWIKRPAPYTEFYLKRNKESLVLIIGESWTYGENIKDITTDLGKVNFQTQLNLTLGPKLAMMLRSDLYQYAVPGNCNFYMFEGLKRILKTVSQQGYKKIYVCMQMTESGREESLIEELLECNHPLQHLIRPSDKMSFEQWLEKYDNIFFEEYNKIISQYDNLDCILWKNFCRINSNKRYSTFKIITPTWIQYSSNLLGKDIDAPSFYSIGWLDTIMNDHHYNNISFDKTYLNKEIDIIEESNNFIKSNYLHSNHPNEISHFLWAQYLARQAEWKNDI